MVKTVSDAPVLKIQMLGGFSLKYGETELSEASSRTKQVWNLLQFLIAHRHKEVAQETLFELLWQEEKTENPANALKNLIYRLRRLLNQVGRTAEQEYILYQHGTYIWNNNIPCIVDIEELEKYYKQGIEEHDKDPQCAQFFQHIDTISVNNIPKEITAEKKQHCEDCVPYFQKAIALYQGDFLPKSSYEQWVIPLSVYYRRIFMDCVKRACIILYATERYEEIEQICAQAIRIDPFEEILHEWYISALMANNKQVAAMKHYEYISNLFYTELGIKPSDKIRSLYQEIVKKTNAVETDLLTIKDALREKEDLKGAFFCEYEMFKKIYHLEARTASRSGQAVFVGLLTLTDGKQPLPNSKKKEPLMEMLKNSIMHSLRLGDVFARFSETQYILMIPTITYENGQIVLDRIRNNFYKSLRSSGVIIQTTLMPVDPVLK